MEDYLLDTNILIHYARQSVMWEFVEKNYFRKGLKNHAYLSAVSVGEARAFAYENGWGRKKLQRLGHFLELQNPVSIELEGVFNSYVQISAYSRNRHKSLKLPKGFPAKNMGKNDLWIAASAAATGLPLLSTDLDFEHLHGVFLDFIYIDQQKLFDPATHV